MSGKSSIVISLAPHISGWTQYYFSRIWSLQQPLLTSGAASQYMWHRSRACENTISTFFQIYIWRTPPGSGRKPSRFISSGEPLICKPIWDELHQQVKLWWRANYAFMKQLPCLDTASFLIKRCIIELLIMGNMYLMLSFMNDEHLENRVQEADEISIRLKTLPCENNILLLTLAYLSWAL